MYKNIKDTNIPEFKQDYLNVDKTIAIAADGTIFKVGDLVKDEVNQKVSTLKSFTINRESFCIMAHTELGFGRLTSIYHVAGDEELIECNKITIIVAKAYNNVIGADGGIPFKISEDLKRFKALTIDKPIIMGRKTFESLPGVLPRRPHIVITKNPDFKVDNEAVTVVASLEEALKLCRYEPETFIIGGGEIYRLALEMNVITHMEITEVLSSFAGDITFPDFSEDYWREVNQSYVYADDKTHLRYRFLSYQKTIKG